VRDIICCEIPFDPPHPGFGRVFFTPDSGVVILESKGHACREFHPGQTQHGEQDSLGWIVAQAGKMADPHSAQWSPADGRITVVIREMGPENVPVVAVVIKTEAGRIM